MNDSMAQPRSGLTSLELPGWKTALSWTAAVLLALLFVVAGVWKLTDAPGAAVRMAQAKVPESLSLFAAIAFGIAETVSGILLLVPRYRRWGALASALLLVAFMIYIGIYYDALRGEECSCFPWVKRAVGPAFFIGDGIMLLFAWMAWIWARPSEGLRGATLVLVAVVVFAGASYGVSRTTQSGTKAPDSVMVDGKPYSLQSGKIFVYYFDPECMHCFDAAKRMSKMNWGSTKVLGVPIQNPQFSGQFLRDTGLQAAISPEVQKLRPVFPFVSAPAGVALENGREKAPLTKFDGDEPGATLKQLGFIQ
jgi:uncharacterized membrane protein YphA (DoxX/SURF4 family)